MSSDIKKPDRIEYVHDEALLYYDDKNVTLDDVMKYVESTFHEESPQPVRLTSIKPIESAYPNEKIKREVYKTSYQRLLPKDT
jgi:hypothetical protein